MRKPSFPGIVNGILIIFCIDIVCLRARIWLRSAGGVIGMVNLNINLAYTKLLTKSIFYILFESCHRHKLRYIVKW